MTPASFFPIPTPDAIQKFVLAMFEGGINLGRVISEAVFEFVSAVGVGIA